MDSMAKRHGGHARAAKQDRSRASFERVLDAAESLLREKRYGDVTLSQVSKRARVSIGSIYGRVASKDDLLRALQVRVLSRIEMEHHAMVNGIRRRELPLAALMPTIVRELADFLRRHAAILSVFIERASFDPVIAAKGKHDLLAAERDMELLILERRNEIAHPDPEHAAHVCFLVAYASLARYLGLGNSSDVAGVGDWKRLVDDLGLMCLYFLTFDSHPPARTRASIHR